MIPPELMQHLERAVDDALAGWPPAWQGFHWPGYTLLHARRVRCLARRLAAEEGADAEVVDLAALLHDIAKASGRGHAERGAERARELLDGGLPGELVESIAETVAHHNCAEPGDPLEWRILSDADKIDANFGLVAVTRYFTIRGGRNCPLDEALAFIPEWEQRHLELLDALTTAAGRRCGEERLAVMNRFCRDAMAGGVPRAIAQFLLDDSAAPDLPSQADRLATRGIPGASAGATRAIAERLRREMAGEI